MEDKELEKKVNVSLKNKTDWERLAKMTDADIEKAVASDPDAAPLMSYEELRRKGQLHPPRTTRTKT